MLRPLTLASLLFTAMTTLAADITLVDNGQAATAIYVEPAIMADDVAVPRTAPHEERTAETHRQRLRESVRDLALYLGRISGAEIPIHTRAPEDGDAGVPLLIGALAEAKFGPPGVQVRFAQGWRLVVAPEGVGFIGESDESTSYAIYELLDRLGCRWFIPGEIGEVIPSMATIALEASDTSAAPTTFNRRIWYASPAYDRRNRQGGFTIAAGHALNNYVSKEQMEANPELAAETDGKRKVGGHFLCWGNPETAKVAAATIIARLDAQYQPSVSLSPADGMGFCECEKYCKPLDAGDWDPSVDLESITDRYIVFCNRIAEQVTAKYPDVLFGFLAYVHYTRPPVRETPHPNLVPEIAPITYCRAHSMLADNCPSRPRLKPIVEGWNTISNQFAYYNYMFHLAETTVPYPMIRQMSEELPIIYGGTADIFWQPETMPNFESVLPGMWLSIRMAWNSDQQPADIMDDFFTGFHGAAAEPMRRYWTLFDDAWNDTPEHAGAGWGHARRFTPEIMQAARQAMDEALAAAATPMEYRRVAIFNEALQQFERYMQMRWDLNTGKSAWLDVQAMEWMGTQIGFGNQYADNYAFTRVPWSAVTNIGAGYFSAFNKRTYDEIGERTGRRGTYSNVMPPLSKWHYSFLANAGNTDSQKGIDQGEANGWHTPDFDHSEWPVTDLATETWASIGLLGKYGTAWYRTTVTIPARTPKDKAFYIWVPATDGSAKLFINGTHIPYTKDDGTAPVASGYTQPFTWDVSEHLTPGEEAQITIAGSRLFINELGTGGLLAPVYVLRQR